MLSKWKYYVLIGGSLIAFLLSYGWTGLSQSDIRSCDNISIEATYHCLKYQLSNTPFRVLSKKGGPFNHRLSHNPSFHSFQTIELGYDRILEVSLSKPFVELMRLLLVLLIIYSTSSLFLTWSQKLKGKAWLANIGVVILSSFLLLGLGDYFGSFTLFESRQSISIIILLFILSVFSLHFFIHVARNRKNTFLLAISVIGLLILAVFSVNLNQHLPFVEENPAAYQAIAWVYRAMISIAVITIGLQFIQYIHIHEWAIKMRIGVYLCIGLLTAAFTFQSYGALNGIMAGLITVILFLLIDMSAEERRINFLWLISWLLVVNLHITYQWTSLEGNKPEVLEIFNYFSLGFIASMMLAMFLILINSVFINLPSFSSLRIPKQLLLRHKFEILLLGTLMLSFSAIGIVTSLIETKQQTSIQKERFDWLAELNDPGQVTKFNGIYLDTFDLDNSDGQAASLDYDVLRHFQLRNTDLVSEPFVYFKSDNEQVLRAGPKRFSFHERYNESILSKLLNVYVFLFLTAVGLIYIFTGQVTRPLAMLGQKLQAIDLGKENKELEWKYEDEIGHLIQQYNSMLDQLQHSAANLAENERDHAWKEMAKQVAHEIKNPLTPMKLNIQHLTMRAKGYDGDLSEQVMRVSRTLIEQIDNLTRIANEFSQFGQMPLVSNDKVLMNDVVTSVHDLFRKREDMDIQCFVPIDDLYIFADKDHLIRILNNVVKNAIQSIPRDKKGSVVLRLYREQHDAVVSVTDNGIGIPDEQKSKVFKPNFTTKSSGTGLGLAMCSKMVESMNGRIYFETKIDHGSTFFIQVPLMRIEENYTEESEIVELEE